MLHWFSPAAMRLLSHNSNRLITQVSHSCLRSITSQRKLKHAVETSTTTTHNQKPPATQQQQQQQLDLDLVYPNLVAHIVRGHLVIKLAKESTKNSRSEIHNLQHYSRSPKQIQQQVSLVS
jgi:hypothetical protein